jgi:hypothetical protein
MVATSGDDGHGALSLRRMSRSQVDEPIKETLGRAPPQRVRVKTYMTPHLGTLLVAHHYYRRSPMAIEVVDTSFIPRSHTRRSTMSSLTTGAASRRAREQQ